MNIHWFQRATALASIVFLTGCAGAAPVEELDEPVLTPRTGGGTSGGTNGGSSDDHHALEAAMLRATDGPLVWPGTMMVHPAIVNDLLAQPGGVGVFEHAVQCALDENEGNGYVSTGARQFYGRGHLDTTAGWMSGALGPGGKNTLFACMATLFNAYLVRVPVVLKGKTIVPDGLDYSAFNFKEAAWTARVIEGANGREVHYTIWPTQAFDDHCVDSEVSVLITRVCGINPDYCRLDLGGRFEDHCQESKGGIKCDGRDVIVTYLELEDFFTLNPTCLP